VPVQITQQPLLLPVGPAGDVKVASTAAANSVVDVRFLM
jgi:hypothetical protein